MERLKQQLRFILELDKQKEIGRQTYLADGSRKEGDAEHAWHMAVMAFLLADYSNVKIDVLKTMKMILLHDVIEIDAGDTYAYDDKANKTKKARELKAADRIYGMLPEDQERNTGLCGRNLRQWKRRKQSLPIHWIKYSRCF